MNELSGDRKQRPTRMGRIRGECVSGRGEPGVAKRLPATSRSLLAVLYGGFV